MQKVTCGLSENTFKMRTKTNYQKPSHLNTFTHEISYCCAVQQISMKKFSSHLASMCEAALIEMPRLFN